MVPQNLLLANSSGFLFGGNYMKEEEFFNNYTEQYDKTLSGIYLKYNHSYRVVEKSMQVAKSLKLNKKDIDFVRVCALFHDIARFEQYTIYNHFDDTKSFDHGLRGTEILKENGYKNRVLLNVVEYHNDTYLPKYLDKESTFFSKIIRDADKVDILEHQGLECKTENYKIPEKILNLFRKHKLLDSQIKQLENGNLLSIYSLQIFLISSIPSMFFSLIKSHFLLIKSFSFTILILSLKFKSNINAVILSSEIRFPFSNCFI